MSVYINQSYIDLKIVELYLAFEYQQKKQQEKEEQRELRAQQREEAKLKKEYFRRQSGEALCSRRAICADPSGQAVEKLRLFEIRPAITI